MMRLMFGAFLIAAAVACAIVIVPVALDIIGILMVGIL